MTKKSVQLEKLVVMTVTIISMLLVGCEDRFDSRRGNPVGEGEPVEVTLRIGLAEGEDGYNLSAPSMKADMSGGKTTFGLDLVPSARTKAGTATSLQPDALYNLEIRQYDSTGAYLKGCDPITTNTGLGTPITTTLTTKEHCQLVLVAWGNGNTNKLGTGTLSATQDVIINASVIKDLKPEVQADMNKMPYVLHLKDVNVTSDGRIYSAEGEALDVRLRLKRLATRLTVNWTYDVTISDATYSLKQILLHSIPTNYKVVAAPDKTDKTYPSLLDQFTTIQVPADSIVSGRYSCWIPANVRGSNPNATSQAYRIKSNAPTGSSYIRFISIMNGTGNENKKLDYRLYLGGKETTDFNLYGNTDYSYTARFTHTQLPVSDLRVTIVDPVSASVDNRNFVPTANCFMVAPGGAFNFNPYKYTQNGAVIDNSVLQGWCNTDNVKIQSVKVFWQTLENGDVGDPVLGTANSSTDHTNIVDLTDGTDFGKARIYCRVAPNTTGGSGLIAAYSGADGTGEILWSWHIWVTDYAPDVTGNADVQTPVNKRKQKYVGNSAPDQLPMMDRSLGAMAGYNSVPETPLERSKTNGFHYQQGRKDPFPSSYTTKTMSEVPNIYSATPPKDMLNLYGPDGLTYKPRERGDMANNIRIAYRNPIKMYTISDLSVAQGSAWGGNVKTVHDPCPAGWRIAAKENYRALFNGGYYVTKSEGLVKKDPRLAPGFAWNDGKESGGYLIVYNDAGYTTYFRMTGFGNNSGSFVIVGEAGNVWTRDTKVTFDFGFNANKEGKNAYEVSEGWQSADAHTTRCIQERAD